ncbi:hypothetical protein RJ639_038256 [Escallonia herrerae]|uniref:Uncharacterized protein n=1 Tax=Escallonia herrerae TaxID=1293975 RepID=A0AA88WN00_9ASTE|nr:hypothetical protein RJ639_038256 [Escallonia herrerae]
MTFADVVALNSKPELVMGIAWVRSPADYSYYVTSGNENRYRDLVFCLALGHGQDSYDGYSVRLVVVENHLEIVSVARSHFVVVDYQNQNPVVLDPPKMKVALVAEGEGTDKEVAMEFEVCVWEGLMEIDVDGDMSGRGTSTLRSQVGTSTPQASTSMPRRDALGDIKDEAEDKFDEDTWFTANEKRNKMTNKSIIELLEEFPLPPPFSAQVLVLQEPANYGTNFETSVYEGQIKYGYRIPMHLFDVAFFNYYKMAPGQLVPNGWRKLLGLIYLMQTSRYPVTIHDFMRRLPRGKGRRAQAPVVKRSCAPSHPIPPLVVEDLPIDKDPIFSPRWTIKRGDSGMPSSHVSAQHLTHEVLPSDKLILENQPHEAFAMAHVQATYNAYCYSSQMEDMFTMAMNVARIAKTEKRVAVGKSDKLDKKVKDLKSENTDLLTKLGHLKKRCEKVRHEKAEAGNKAIQAFLDGTTREEWLRKRT